MTFRYDPLARKGVFLVGHAARDESRLRMGEGGKGEGGETSLKRVNEVFAL